jgi:hypothetical protein
MVADSVIAIPQVSNDISADYAAVNDVSSTAPYTPPTPLTPDNVDPTPAPASSDDGMPTWVIILIIAVAVIIVIVIVVVIILNSSKGEEHHSGSDHEDESVEDKPSNIEMT